MKFIPVTHIWTSHREVTERKTVEMDGCFPWSGKKMVDVKETSYKEEKHSEVMMINTDNIMNFFKGPCGATQIFFKHPVMTDLFVEKILIIVVESIEKIGERINAKPKS